MSRQELHTLIETDTPLPDEMEAIKQGEKELKSGDVYTHEEVWGM